MIIANLLLHQFKFEELKQLGTRIPAKCSLILAVEPARSRMTLWLGRALTLDMLLALFALSALFRAA